MIWKGVLERTDQVGQLQGQLEGAQEEIKKLKGDMQTREREIYHAKQKAELEKFKSDLDKTNTQSKSAGKLFEKRLDDALGQVKSEVRSAVAQSKKRDTSKS